MTEPASSTLDAELRRALRVGLPHAEGMMDGQTPSLPDILAMAHR
jgi:hypothetical protein